MEEKSVDKSIVRVCFATNFEGFGTICIARKNSCAIIHTSIRTRRVHAEKILSTAAKGEIGELVAKRFSEKINSLFIILSVIILNNGSTPEAAASAAALFAF